MKVMFFCPLDLSQYQEYLPQKNIKKSIVPWAVPLIHGMSQQSGVELSVCSYSSNISRDVKFNHQCVDYQIFKLGVPFLTRGYSRVRSVDLKTDYFLLNRRILAHVRRVRPDIIHIHGVEHPYSSLSYKLKSIPVLVTFLGFVHSHTKYVSDKKTKYSLNVEEKTIKKCHNFAVRANFMEAYLKSQNPSSHIFWHDYPLESSFFNKITTNDRKIDFIFFSRVCQVKGVEDLIQAAGILKKTNVDFTVKIVGPVSQSYKLHLNQLLSQNNVLKNVKFTGYLSQKNTAKEVADSKIMVLPSYHDTLPLTVAEAMQSKTAVIAYDVGGIPDLLENGKNGILVKPHDIQELAAAMSTLLSDHQLRENYVSNGYTYANKRFVENGNQIAPKLVSIYEKIIKDTQGSK